MALHFNHNNFSVVQLTTGLKYKIYDAIALKHPEFEGSLIGRMTGMLYEGSTLQDTETFLMNPDVQAARITECLVVLATQAHTAIASLTAKVASLSTSPAAGGQVPVRLAADDVAPLGSASIAAASAPAAADNAAFPPLPVAGGAREISVVEFRAAPFLPAPAAKEVISPERLHAEKVIKAILARLLPSDKPHITMRNAIYYALVGGLDNDYLKRMLGIYTGRGSLDGLLYPKGETEVDGKKVPFPRFPAPPLRAMDRETSAWADIAYDKLAKDFAKMLGITPDHPLANDFYEEDGTLCSLDKMVSAACTKWSPTA